MKKNYKNYFSFFAIAVTGIFSIYSATGPGTTYGANVTGAPFDIGTCTSCHGPGANWNASLTVQLFSGSTPVTTYVPNASYTLRISRSAAGLPGNGGFGFQATCATGATNLNNNGWGTLPANVQAVTLNSRNYVEHETKFSNSTTQVSIPWTAPSSVSTGLVVFYVALNTVDGTGNNSNDEVLNTSLSISPSPTPVTWLYFEGKEHDGKILLEWATANEVNNSFYTLEKSANGLDFEMVGKISAVKGAGFEQQYSFEDKATYKTSYYRIKQTDLSGESSYFNTIKIVSGVVRDKGFHYLTDKFIIMSLSRAKDEPATAVLYNLSGILVSSSTISLAEGANAIYVQKPSSPGIYMMQVATKNEIVYTSKVFVD